MTDTSLQIQPPLSDILPPPVAIRWGVVPLSGSDDKTVSIATTRPNDIELEENLRSLFKKPIQLVSRSEEDLEKLIQATYGLGAETLDELMSEPDVTAAELETESDDAAMARFVQSLFHQALQERATDIHIEPFETDMLIRIRVDGYLRRIPTPQNLIRLQQRLITRLKVMAHLNIAEKRLPQDGRIRFKLKGDDIDIRVSTLPTIYGESVDLRLLPRTRLILGLKELGMNAADRATLEHLIQKPNGILLVTGPTGHGKTTTLYACLSQINSPEKKIITIEDPVEYRLKGVNQVQVHPKIGMSFARGLRSILRQDPDVLMIGEIRDFDTAEIAIRASLTGHLVFSTLHTNDAVGAITRLLDMGVEPYLVASSIQGVLAQRLVRTRCTACPKKEACPVCHGTGFHGRTGLFEFLHLNEDLRTLIVQRASAAVIRKEAKKQGMRTLFEDGQEKVTAGITTPTEVFRVTEEV